MGEDLFLNTKFFNGARVTHIRRYKLTKDGEKYPTLKGVCLASKQVILLMNARKDIFNVLKEIDDGNEVSYSVNIDNNTSVDISYPYRIVHIRHFFMKDEKLCPTKRGVCLRKFEFAQLARALDAMVIAQPDILSHPYSNILDDTVDFTDFLGPPQMVSTPEVAYSPITSSASTSEKPKKQNRCKSRLSI